ncbi:MAG: hypothetical protein NVSMB19_10420 [Vulcanimicrobiaceae bacterium]
MGLAWPDIAIGIVAIFGTLKGFKRGFVSELRGAVALAFGVAAAFAYGGTWDVWLRDRMHMGTGTAHVAGMVLYALLAYTIVYALGSALALVAKLPLVGTANALLGAFVGALKSAVFAWAVVYVALFFPLTAELRDDLHRSHLVAALQAPNSALDLRVRDALPPFVRPFAELLFARHHV